MNTTQTVIKEFKENLPNMLDLCTCIIDSYPPGIVLYLDF